jgi:hypothetical protein
MSIENEGRGGFFDVERDEGFAREGGGRGVEVGLDGEVIVLRVSELWTCKLLRIPLIRRRTYLGIDVSGQAIVARLVGRGGSTSRTSFRHVDTGV